MKQGKATTFGNDSKTEPMSKAINPGAVADIGNMKGNHADTGDMPFTSTPMDAGRGYRAPGIGSTTHKGGSQGKH
jgi:hypothetical protein